MSNLRSENPNYILYSALKLVYIIARSASCSATQGFKWLVCVCVFVTDFSDFCGYWLHRGHPLFPLLSFQLGFSGIPENHEKTSKSYLGEASRRTPFWDPFLSFFLKKFRFSLEGLVKVRHLVLARTTGDFAQPCPAGQSRNKCRYNTPFPTKDCANGNIPPKFIEFFPIPSRLSEPSLTMGPGYDARLWTWSCHWAPRVNVCIR